MKNWTPRTSFVASPDGLRLAVYEAGNPAGRALLFVHGFSQCAMCWVRQFDDPLLAAQFRLVALDIRGHGGSGKPSDATHYADDRLFAGDVQAVMAALNLTRPVIVAWSYAGRVISDYVLACGAGNLAGINYVCADTVSEPSYYGPGIDPIAGMKDDRIAENIAATRQFLAACWTVPPDAATYEAILAYNMAVTPEIRRHLLSRTGNDGTMLSKLDIPVLVTHGADDGIVLPAMGEFTARMVRGAKLSLYDGIGHSPFMEDAPRFNRELSAFASSAFEKLPI